MKLISVMNKLNETASFAPRRCYDKFNFNVDINDWWLLTESDENKAI